MLLVHGARLHPADLGEIISDLERSYRLEDSVIKYLTVRMKPAVESPPAANEVREHDRVQ